MMARPRERRRRRLWTKEEDDKLVEFISKYSVHPLKGTEILAVLDRKYKSCWERYNNHLKPGVIKVKFFPEEDDIIIRFHSRPGNRWAFIRDYHLPWRTANDIKNRWNNHLKKKLATSTHQNTPDKQLFQLNQNNPTTSSSSIVISVSTSSNEIINSGSLMAWNFLNSNETNFEGDYFANWNYSGLVSESPENEFMPTEEVTRYWSP